MKNFILMAGLLLCGIAQAQLITVTGKNGEPITNGYEYVTHALTGPTADLPIRVRNISDTPINLKLRVESMQNTNGQDVFFCFGNLCYFTINQGKTVPNSNQAPAGMTLQPGQENPEDNHFLNGNPGTGGDVTVVLGIVQYDNAGIAMGDPLVTFTYRYSPTAGTSDFNALQNMGITIDNTVITSHLNLTATQSAKMEVYTMAGQLVKSEAVKEGTYTADLSSLSAAVYIARFTNEENKTSQIRIVKN